MPDLTPTRLLEDITAVGAGSSISPRFDRRTFQAIASVTAGTGKVAVDIEVSNDNANWLRLGTITLTLGTAATNDGMSANTRWLWVRANVRTISGTGAKVTLIMVE